MTRTTCELSRHQLSTINLRERTININVTYSVCVKTRRHGICSNKRNFHWKKCFPFPKSPQRSIWFALKDFIKPFEELQGSTFQSQIYANLFTWRWGAYNREIYRNTKLTWLLFRSYKNINKKFKILLCWKCNEMLISLFILVSWSLCELNWDVNEKVALCLIYINYITRIYRTMDV